MKKHTRLILTFIFILAVLGLSYITGVQDYFSTERIVAVFDENILVSSIIYIIFFTIGILIQIPGVIFLSASILILGIMKGYLLTLIAAIIATSISFFLIRIIGQDSLRKINIKWVQILLSRLDKKPILITTILRIVFQTSPPLNYALAVSGVKYRTYLLGTVLGLPIPIFIYALTIEYIKSST